MRRLAACTVALACALALGVLDASGVRAQTASAGAITGAVTMATEGEALDPSLLEVEVIILAEGGVTGTKPATVDGEAYEVQVDADAALTYIPRATYDGVSYFGGAVRLDEDTSTEARDFTVYATTSETPPLEVKETVVTVIAIDRGTGELGFIREDLVHNPTDRVFTGSGGEDGAGITLRLPAPEGTVEALGENADGQFALEGGVMTTTTPIRPGDNAIITRYLTEYDIAEDEYALRITAPVDTGRVVLRVPESYVRDLAPQPPAQQREAQPIQVTEDSEPVLMLIAEASDLGPGDGLLVTLDGFAPQVNRNVLTDSPQAIAGALAALLLIGGAAAYALSRPRGGVQPPASDSPAEGA